MKGLLRPKNNLISVSEFKRKMVVGHNRRSYCPNSHFKAKVFDNRKYTVEGDLNNNSSTGHQDHEHFNLH